MTTNPISEQVRPAGFEDAEAIFALIKSYPHEILPRPISDVVQNIDRFLVLERDGAVAGVVSWKILPEIGAPQNPSIEIQSLAVDKNFQGQGIGTALVQAAIARIRSTHPAQIIALTFCKPFFVKLGFREVPKKTLMHKIYAGCINCTKYESPFTCPEIAMILEAPEPTGDE